LEQEYIGQSHEFQIIVIDGVAPLQYTDAEGEIRGITRLVLDEIAASTGLRFTYLAVDSTEEARTIDAPNGIVAAIDSAYIDSFPNMTLSQPFLQAPTVLFLHKSVDANNLTAKTFAGVKGGNLPPDVLPENAIYYNTREDAIRAVNAGEADYGYGNAYSVVTYMISNRYKNVVTIPMEKEQRQYSLGLLQPDDLLLSILNKAIAAIDENKMQAIILLAASQMEQPLTLARFLEDYNIFVDSAALVIISLLALWIVYHRRTQATLQLQNQRYELLAELSNEFMFEYDPRSGGLALCQRCLDFFGPCAETVQETIKASLNAANSQRQSGTAYEIKLPSIACKEGTFRIIAGNIFDNRGQLQTVIGKLVDVSKETAEIEALVTRAQLDGLTGVFNAATIRELVDERLEQKGPKTHDAFLLLDADSFKQVNDNLGHYTGDQVLKELATVIKRTFRATDIIGRHGGDEFCVYMKNIPSVEFVHNKCRQLINSATRTIEGVTFSICVGAVIIMRKQSYDEIFQAADAALYQAKNLGHGEAVVVDQRPVEG